MLIKCFYRGINLPINLKKNLILIKIIFWNIVQLSYLKNTLLVYLKYTQLSYLNFINSIISKCHVQKETMALVTQPLTDWHIIYSFIRIDDLYSTRRTCISRMNHKLLFTFWESRELIRNIKCVFHANERKKNHTNDDGLTNWPKRIALKNSWTSNRACQRWAASWSCHT